VAFFSAGRDNPVGDSGGREKTMDAALQSFYDRIRNSKRDAKYGAEDAEGYIAGRRWALQAATFTELENLHHKYGNMTDEQFRAEMKPFVAGSSTMGRMYSPSRAVYREITAVELRNPQDAIAGGL
jgi:hypothetical protein